MDPRLNTYLTKVASSILLLAGVIVVLIGYIGVRGESSVELQLPYIASGGLGGLGLIGLGIAGLLWTSTREQAAHIASVVDSLEEWKVTALADLRHFLETADVQLEVRQPATPTIARKRVARL